MLKLQKYMLKRLTLDLLQFHIRQLQERCKYTRQYPQNIVILHNILTVQKKFRYLVIKHICLYLGYFYKNHCNGCYFKSVLVLFNQNLMKIVKTAPKNFKVMLKYQSIHCLGHTCMLLLEG